MRLIRDNVLAIDGDTDRAIDIVEAFLPRIEDLRVRNGAKVVLLNFYSDSNKKEKFRPLAEEVLKAFSGSTSDYNHRNFAVLADGCGEHEFALKLNGVAEEAYRKDFEQKTDRAKERAKQFLASIIAERAVILLHAGRYTDSLATFDEAAEMAVRDVLGQPNLLLLYDGYLHHYWGLALKGAGDLKGAMDMLAYTATVKNDEAALADLMKIYLETNGDKEGFDSYLIQKHLDFSKAAPQFTLNDLEGREVSPASLKGKVILIYFWAHT